MDEAIANSFFVKTGLPLVRRGFYITPLHPATKCAVIPRWQKHQARSLTGLLRYAKGKYADYNLGVVSWKGLDNLCFLDIDADGVVQRIEQETGRTIPATYTVCSRPDTAPFKRHYYFRQTAYSLRCFTKTVNVRDVSRLVRSDSGLMMHPTLYDLKGVGGGSLVVAAGSVRDSGEVYRCIDETPPIPIPDWLVDWLVGDIRRYKLAKIEDVENKIKRKDELMNKISQDDVYYFLCGSALKYAAAGSFGNKLIDDLKFTAATYCEGGEEFVESLEGQAMIEKITGAKRKPFDSFDFHRRQLQNLRKSIESPIQSDKPGLVVKGNPSKTRLITSIIEVFPRRIRRREALGRIETGLAEDGLKFDQRKDKNKLMAARKAAGYVVSGDQWEKRQRLI